MKKLIVNADDFGLTDSVNRAIIRTFLDGILTSTSIMANGESFENAVVLAKQNPALSIGIHLVLVEEKPVLSPSEVPSLISKNQKLFKNYQEFLKNFMLRRIAMADVEKELRAQIEKILATDIEIFHIDSHQHLHIYPPILKLVIRLTKEYGIKWIRNSYDASRPTSLGQTGLALLAKKGKRTILKSKMNTSDYFFGAGCSGHLTEADVLKALHNISNGVSELMCHPGEEDQHLTRKYAHWNFMWNREQEAIISQKVKDFIKNYGIKLTNFREG